MRRLGIGRVAGAVALALAILPALSATALTTAPLPREDYPTWDEVQAARADESAATELVSSISVLLDELQAESARLGEAAIEQSAIAAQAATARDAAQQVADRLELQAGAAAERAAESASRAAQVAAALVRSSGPDMSLSLLADDGSLLTRLGMLDRVGGQVDRILDQARLDRNSAEALADQATAARDVLAELADDARRSADEASAAAVAAQERVADQQAHLDELYSQLAALKNTTAEQERLYRIGQQIADDPGDPGPVDPGPIGGGDDLGTIGNEYNDPAGAKSYAWSMFPQFGWSDGQTDCLVALWNRESGWRTNAYNASSGAYGIPQSLPGTKMAAVGSDWRTNYRTQVLWGFYYIQNRYGSPCGAWAHSEAVGWY